MPANRDDDGDLEWVDFCQTRSRVRIKPVEAQKACRSCGTTTNGCQGKGDTMMFLMMNGE